MELQITKKEASERGFKAKVTSAFGIPVFLFGVFMIVGKVYDAITGNCPDCHFSIATEIIPTLLLGYSLFAAKDTLITGMFGLLLPKKK